MAVLEFIRFSSDITADFERRGGGGVGSQPHSASNLLRPETLVRSVSSRTVTTAPINIRVRRECGEYEQNTAPCVHIDYKFMCLRTMNKHPGALLA